MRQMEQSISLTLRREEIWALSAVGLCPPVKVWSIVSLMFCRFLSSPIPFRPYTLWPSECLSISLVAFFKVVCEWIPLCWSNLAPVILTRLHSECSKCFGSVFKFIIQSTYEWNQVKVIDYIQTDLISDLHTCTLLLRMCESGCKQR